MAKEARAAYAASQPLFDVLRTAAANVDEQKAILSEARDLVQNIHIKLPNVTGLASDSDDQPRYMASILKAWTSALGVYNEIVSALVKAAAGDPAEGKEAAYEHATLTKIAGTVRSAQKAVTEHEQAQQARQTGSQRTYPAPSRTSLTMLGKRAMPSEEPEQPPQKKQHLRDQEPQESGGQDAMRDALPLGSDGVLEKKARKTEERKQRRRRKQAYRAKQHLESTQIASEDEQSRPMPPQQDGQEDEDDRPAGQNHTPPDGTDEVEVTPYVEYDDVSAEVEARLKAKEDAKRAKKEEKKRKRASEESLNAQKPTAKKTKSNSHADLGEVTTQLEPPKRKHGVAEAEDGAGVGGLKKCKKTVG